MRTWFKEVSESWDGRDRMIQMPIVGKVNQKPLTYLTVVAGLIAAILAMSAMKDTPTQGQPGSLPVSTGSTWEDILIADLEESVES